MSASASFSHVGVPVTAHLDRMVVAMMKTMIIQVVRVSRSGPPGPLSVRPPSGVQPEIGYPHLLSRSRLWVEWPPGRVTEGQGVRATLRVGGVGGGGKKCGTNALPDW